MIQQAHNFHIKSNLILRCFLEVSCNFYMEPK